MKKKKAMGRLIRPRTVSWCYVSVMNHGCVIRSYHMMARNCRVPTQTNSSPMSWFECNQTIGVEGDDGGHIVCFTYMCICAHDLCTHVKSIMGHIKLTIPGWHIEQQQEILIVPISHKVRITTHKKTKIRDNAQRKHIWKTKGIIPNMLDRRRR